MLLMFDDAGLNPRSLFAAGEQGFWYDPSDFSTMFQDAAGTTPVTAVGQSVGRINDKSGRGNHATQSTALSRPTLQQDATGRYYLSLDGTDDGMATPSIDFTGTDKLTLWAGVRKNSDATQQSIVELSTISTSPQSFSMAGPSSAGTASFAFTSRGNATTAVANALSGFPSPITAVITSIGAISTDTCIMRVNGAQAASGTADQGTGNYGNYPLYIGRRAGTSLPFNGRLYQLIGRGAETPLAQIRAMERYVNSKTGASF